MEGEREEVYMYGIRQFLKKLRIDYYDFVSERGKEGREREGEGGGNSKFPSTGAQKDAHAPHIHRHSRGGKVSLSVGACVVWAGFQTQGF
jgi:hypothetical protein